MSTFAARLNQIRPDKGPSSWRLPQLTGLSRQGLFKLEQPGSDPKLSTLLKLAAALEVPATDLLPSADSAPALTGQTASAKWERLQLRLCPKRLTVHSFAQA